MVHLTGAAERLSRALAQAEILDFACFLQLGHGLDGGLDGLFRVYTVAVVEVDGVGLEAPEGFVACFADVGGIIADGAGAVWGGIICEFGGEEDLGAFAPGLTPST